MKIANAYGRANEEWVGATADTPVPPRVRLRVFERYQGNCYLSGRKIRPGDKWELEHVRALTLGGENRESNLAPALKDPHKIKTAQDRDMNAKLDRIAKCHNGIKQKKKKMGYRKFNGEIVPPRYE